MIMNDINIETVSNDVYARDLMTKFCPMVVLT